MLGAQVECVDVSLLGGVEQQRLSDGVEVLDAQNGSFLRGIYLPNARQRLQAVERGKEKMTASQPGKQAEKERETN